jgi:hypothetical protein
MLALFTALKKHGILQPLGGKPPDAGTWENPSFTVAVTSEEAVKAREEWKARGEADKEKKREELWWDGLAKEKEKEGGKMD